MSGDKEYQEYLEYLEYQEYLATLGAGESDDPVEKTVAMQKRVAAEKRQLELVAAQAEADRELRKAETLDRMTVYEQLKDTAVVALSGDNMISNGLQTIYNAILPTPQGMTDEEFKEDLSKRRESRLDRLKESPQYGVGNIVSDLATGLVAPSYAGARIGVAAAEGAAWMAADNILRANAEQEDINPWDLAKDTAIGAAGGAAVGQVSSWLVGRASKEIAKELVDSGVPVSQVAKGEAATSVFDQMEREAVDTATTIRAGGKSPKTSRQVLRELEEFVQSRPELVEEVRGIDLRQEYLDKVKAIVDMDEDEFLDLSVRASKVSGDPVDTPKARRVLGKAGEKVAKKAEDATKEADVLVQKGMNPDEAVKVASVRAGLGEKQPATPRIAQRLARRMAERGGIVKALDKGVGTYLTRLKSLSYSAGSALARMESKVHVQLGEVKPLLDEVESAFKGLPRSVRKDLESSALTGGPRMVLERASAKGTLTPELKAAMEKLDPVLSSLGKRILKGTEVKTLGEGRWWPRRRKADTDRGVLGKETTPFETTRSVAGRSTKERTVEAVRVDDLKNYESPIRSLQETLETEIRKQSAREFFGSYWGGSADYGETVLQSIGKFVKGEIEAGRLLPENAKEVHGLLKSRFLTAEEVKTSSLSIAESMTQLLLLGQVKTVLLNITDVANTVAKNGLRSTVDAIAGRVPKGINPDTVGLGDRFVMEVEDNVGKSASAARFMQGAVQWVFEKVGFVKLERATSNLALKASYSRLRRQVSTNKGAQEFRTKYSSFAESPQELEEVIGALKSGEDKGKVLEYMFAELLEVKPVSKSSKSQLFSEGAGRYLGILKSFVVQQMDIGRREIIQELAHGSKRKGAENAVKYLTAWTLIGGSVATGIDALRGEPIDEETIEDNIIDNLLILSGLSSMNLRDLEEKGPVAAFTNWMAPAPIAAAERLYRDVENAVVTKDPRVVRNIPIIGEPLYDFAFGGKELRRARTLQRRRREARTRNRSWREREAARLRREESLKTRYQ